MPGEAEGQVNEAGNQENVEDQKISSDDQEFRRQRKLGQDELEEHIERKEERVEEPV